MTIGSQVFAAKKQLLLQLLPVIQAWETEHGLRIDDLHVVHDDRLGDIRSTAVSIEVALDLERLA